MALSLMQRVQAPILFWMLLSWIGVCLGFTIPPDVEQMGRRHQTTSSRLHSTNPLFHKWALTNTHDRTNSLSLSKLQMFFFCLFVCFVLFFKLAQKWNENKKNWLLFLPPQLLAVNCSKHFIPRDPPKRKLKKCALLMWGTKLNCGMKWPVMLGSYLLKAERNMWNWFVSEASVWWWIPQGELWLAAAKRMRTWGRSYQSLTASPQKSPVPFVELSKYRVESFQSWSPLQTGNKTLVRAMKNLSMARFLGLFAVHSQEKISKI